MSAAQHTQKPWRWVEGTDAIEVDWNSKAWTIASVGNCRLGWHEDKNCEGREAGANARLIAAGPELLEALQNLENDAGQMPASAWEMVQRAVFKATGVRKP